MLTYRAREYRRRTTMQPSARSLMRWLHSSPTFSCTTRSSLFALCTPPKRVFGPPPVTSAAFTLLAAFCTVPRSNPRRLRKHVNPLSAHLLQSIPIPNWHQVFANPSRPIHLDIGCGLCESLLYWASKYPEENFIGKFGAKKKKKILLR